MRCSFTVHFYGIINQLIKNDMENLFLNPDGANSKIELSKW